MFDPKTLTLEELEKQVPLAQERARKYYLDPDIDLAGRKHVPGVENCNYSGDATCEQVALFLEATCPQCLKIIADTLLIELGDRLAGS